MKQEKEAYVFAMSIEYPELQKQNNNSKFTNSTNIEYQNINSEK